MGRNQPLPTVDIKNQDLVALRAILPPIIAAVPNREARLKYRLTRIHDVVLQAARPFDQADRDLVDAYTEKDADGAAVHPAKEDGTPDLTKVTLSDPPAFIAARNELLEEPVADFTAMTIPVSWFEGIDAPTGDLFTYCPFLLVDDSV